VILQTEGGSMTDLFVNVAGRVEQLLLDMQVSLKCGKMKNR
jgi:hypothetical protein